MRKRTRARELALQFLFMLDLRKNDGMEQLKEFLRAESKDAGVQSYAARLIEGVIEKRDELDDKIRAVAENWQLSRMATIDRNILRMAAYEILACQDIPPKVAINEAVDLGKKYSTSNSGRFINGILDKIAHGV